MGLFSRIVPTKSDRRRYAVSELATVLKKLGTNGLGEVLRAITFVGDGYGCYQNFDVRPDATSWPREQVHAFVEKMFPNHMDGPDFVVGRTNGYTFKEGNITVDVFWYWDGDGTLYFRAQEGDVILGEVINYDCKCDYDWRAVAGE